MREVDCAVKVGCLLVGILGFAAAGLAQEKRYPADAVVDVSKPPYEAIPSDDQDDTAALQKAITDNVGTGRTLYLPAGTYELSAPLVAKTKDGMWECHLTIQGAGRDYTVLQLADGAEGFGDPSKPAAVYATGSHWQKGDALDGGGNKAFRNNVRDLTINIGRRNRGAIGIDWAVSNQGTIRDVTIRSRDGGVAGISMRRRIPGPGLIKDVTIMGFQVGVDIGDVQYGLTLEDVKLVGQSVAGIRTDRNLLHMRGITGMMGGGPAVWVTDRMGVITLVDSMATSLKTDAPDIETQGTILMRNVKEHKGEPPIVKFRGELVPPTADTIALPKATGAAGTKALLPIENTPVYGKHDLSDWVAVGPRNEGEKDDTEAIWRAMNAGKGTVYFPKDRTYFLSDTVEIGGSVEQVLGFGAEISLGAAKEEFSNRANPRPLFRIVPGRAQTVFVENVFFNAQYEGEVIFENDSSATLVLKHLAGWIGGSGWRRSYQNTARATGKVFVEDVFMPGWAFRGQKVWARQFNPENNDGDGSMAQVSNVGGELWILGFKTEGPAPFIETKGNGMTELLGAYNYISATNAPEVPSLSVPYIAQDSRVALTFATDNFRASDYKTYIREVRDGVTRDFGKADLVPRNGHQGDASLAVPLYRSE